ncbi:MAG: LLM class flavin-dependent oxidoreductase, partial [Xanthobacteraceae bacterium]
QQPYPVVMNAGGSERGRHYAAKFCDVAFLNLGSSDVDYIHKQIAAYRDLARREYGREIQVWSHAYIVQGETEAEARSFFNYYVYEKGDWEAAENLVNMLGLNSKNLGPERRSRSRRISWPAGAAIPWSAPRNGSWTNSRSSRTPASTA